MTVRWLPAMALSIVVLLTGCAPAAPPQSNTGDTTENTMTAEKSGTGEVRSDLEPLTSRFPQLGTAESAIWLSGTLGGDRVPGPKTYWIDAVVVLPAAEYDALRSLYSYEPAVEAPDVVDALKDSVPSPLLVSDDLDTEFSQGEFRSEVFLNDETRSVVVVSVFQ